MKQAQKIAVYILQCAAWSVSLYSFINAITIFFSAESQHQKCFYIFVFYSGARWLRRRLICKWK